ncbi:AraC family transcriptional regulator [Aminobacter sp. P9b]|uniref:AraC family L-rhamnose operon regulatory protein RhaS n=1 Tax=Aminobacter niigataensis TaxID=83265 RepID=A0ABR6L1M8_9HYPH|nr:AraC family transcriptional regulator [Aminobacter niigataensis]MBB4649936.1 AraC family L-rhamnose operon regulatory protein RhaS [Aminobacter niigataensis]
MQTIVDPEHGFTFGEALYNVGGVYGPLRNRYVTLLLVHEGTAKVTCDDEVTIVESGECGVFRNEQYVLFEYDRGRVSWCEGSPGTLTESIAQRLREVPAKIPISEPLEALQRLGVELGSGSTANLNMLRNALGQTLYAVYFHEAHVSERDRHIPRPVHRARNYIEENSEKDVTINSLADLVARTPQHLILSFRKHIGVTPARYLWQVRGKRARHLLLHSGLTIAEIAYQCGYKNPYHFSRQIKQLFGMSPTEVRANMGYHKPSEVAEDTVDIAY